MYVNSRRPTVHRKDTIKTDREGRLRHPLASQLHHFSSSVTIFAELPRQHACLVITIAAALCVDSLNRKIVGQSFADKVSHLARSFPQEERVLAFQFDGNNLLVTLNRMSLTHEHS